MREQFESEMATIAVVRIPGPRLVQYYDFSMDNGLKSRFSIQEYVHGIALVKCQLITGSSLADLISSDGEYSPEKMQVKVVAQLSKVKTMFYTQAT